MADKDDLGRYWERLGVIKPQFSPKPNPPLRPMDLEIVSGSGWAKTTLDHLCIRCGQLFVEEYHVCPADKLQ